MTHPIEVLDKMTPEDRRSIDFAEDLLVHLLAYGCEEAARYLALGYNQAFIPTEPRITSSCELSREPIDFDRFRRLRMSRNDIITRTDQQLMRSFIKRAARADQPRPVVPKCVIAAINSSARGAYQRGLLAGRDAWDGSYRDGSYRDWQINYQASRDGLLRRINARLPFGWKAKTDNVEGSIELIIQTPDGVYLLWDNFRRVFGATPLTTVVEPTTKKGATQWRRKVSL